MADTDHDTAITEIASVTGCSPEEAKRFLEEAKGDSGLAVELFFQDLDHKDLPDAPPPAQAQDQAAPAAHPEAPSKKAAAPKKFATLDDVKNDRDGEHGHGHHHDDDSDEYNSDSDDKQDMFAGGEKSGLAVQNPPKDSRDQVKKLLERARKHVPRPGGDDDVDEAPESHFSGAGQTLGGDDTPSQVIPDPKEKTRQRKPFVKRTLMLWNDGFSVDDGPLYKFSDPANKPTLDLIQQGRAPLEIMNVEPGQPVDVSLMQMNRDYVQPKQQYKPFAGSGQRLGSPTPGGDSSSTQPAAVPTTSSASTSQPTGSATSTTPSVDVNESAPTLSLQIRLGDGTRLTARFNTTHTIEDVFAFVNASSPSSASRQWTLMTTFPSKELSDKSKALGDISELKRGGVVVQKWL